MSMNQLYTKPQKDTGIAYLLWALSLFGIAGMHRFYLGKPFTAILWFLTFGLFFIGTIYDLFTIPKQIREANWYNR